MFKFKVIFRETWKDYFIFNKSEIKPIVDNISYFANNIIKDKRVMILANESWISFNLDSQSEEQKMENYINMYCEKLN